MTDDNSLDPRTPRTQRLSLLTIVAVPIIYLARDRAAAALTWYERLEEAPPCERVTSILSPRRTSNKRWTANPNVCRVTTNCKAPPGGPAGL